MKYIVLAILAVLGLSSFAEAGNVRSFRAGNGRAAFRAGRVARVFTNTARFVVRRPFVHRDQFIYRNQFRAGYNYNQQLRSSYSYQDSATESYTAPQTERIVERIVEKEVVEQPVEKVILREVVTRPVQRVILRESAGYNDHCGQVGQFRVQRYSTHRNAFRAGFRGY